MSGRIVLYVAGLEEAYWREQKFGEEHEIVDVRQFMPRDPGAAKSLARKSFCDYVVGQDGFVESVVEVTKRAMFYGRAIVGAHTSPHMIPTGHQECLSGAISIHLGAIFSRLGAISSHQGAIFSRIGAI